MAKKEEIDCPAYLDFISEVVKRAMSNPYLHRISHSDLQPNDKVMKHNAPWGGFWRENLFIQALNEMVKDDILVTMLAEKGEFGLNIIEQKGGWSYWIKESPQSDWINDARYNVKPSPNTIAQLTDLEKYIAKRTGERESERLKMTKKSQSELLKKPQPKPKMLNNSNEIQMKPKKVSTKSSIPPTTPKAILKRPRAPSIPNSSFSGSDPTSPVEIYFPDRPAVPTRKKVRFDTTSDLSSPPATFASVTIQNAPDIDVLIPNSSRSADMSSSASAANEPGTMKGNECPGLLAHAAQSIPAPAHNKTLDLPQAKRTNAADEILNNKLSEVPWVLPALQIIRDSHPSANVYMVYENGKLQVACRDCPQRRLNVDLKLQNLINVEIHLTGASHLDNAELRKLQEPLVGSKPNFSNTAGSQIVSKASNPVIPPLRNDLVKTGSQDAIQKDKGPESEGASLQNITRELANAVDMVSSLQHRARDQTTLNMKFTKNHKELADKLAKLGSEFGGRNEEFQTNFEVIDRKFKSGEKRLQDRFGIVMDFQHDLDDRLKAVECRREKIPNAKSTENSEALAKLEKKLKGLGENEQKAQTQLSALEGQTKALQEQTNITHGRTNTIDGQIKTLQAQSRASEEKLRIEKESTNEKITILELEIKGIRQSFYNEKKAAKSEWFTHERDMREMRESLIHSPQSQKVAYATEMMEIREGLRLEKEAAKSQKLAYDTEIKEIKECLRLEKKSVESQRLAHEEEMKTQKLAYEEEIKSIRQKGFRDVKELQQRNNDVLGEMIKRIEKLEKSNMVGSYREAISDSKTATTEPETDPFVPAPGAQSQSTGVGRGGSSAQVAKPSGVNFRGGLRGSSGGRGAGT